MKKTLALVLAVVMVLALLTGCGGSGNQTSTPSTGSNNSSSGSSTSGGSDTAEVTDIVLKVWVPEEELEITQQMADSFNEAHPEYNFSIDLSVVGIDEANSLLETDIDTAADIMQMPTGGIPAEVARGLLLPIVYDIDTVRSLYGEGPLAACTVTTDELGAQLYGIPFSANCFFMFYNKQMYTEDEVQSLETMLAKDLGDDVYNFSCTITDSWYIESFFYAAGCTLFGPDGTDPTECSWNDANGYAAGKYLIDLVKNPKYIENENGIALSLMEDGKLAAFCSGNWSYVDVCDAIGEENVGACKLPTININGADSQLRNFADYKSYVVKSSTAYPLAAQQFVEWMNNEENQLLRYQVNATVPTVVTLVDDPMLEENVSSVALIAQSAVAVEQPSINQMGEYWTPAKALGDGIVYGEVTEANLQAQLDALVNSITTTLTD